MPDHDFQQAMDVLAAWAGAPAEGLPEELFLFLTRLVPMINVELLIRDQQDRTLLTWRDDRRHGAGWHTPGGIIRFREPLESRIQATAEAELGVSVEFDPEPFAVVQHIVPEQRDRSHFISLLYRCRLTGEPDPSRRYTGGTPKPGEWSWHFHCPDNLIVDQAAYRQFFPRP
jgi:colanic acid biosynthesis protein WcaH